MEGLKQDIIDQIKSDGVLFGKVADALGIKPVSLPQSLKTTNSNLTRHSVLKAIKIHLKIKNDSELLTELQDA